MTSIISRDDLWPTKSEMRDEWMERPPDDSLNKSWLRFPAVDTVSVNLDKSPWSMKATRISSHPERLRNEHLATQLQLFNNLFCEFIIETKAENIFVTRQGKGTFSTDLLAKIEDGLKESSFLTRAYCQAPNRKPDAKWFLQWLQNVALSKTNAISPNEPKCVSLRDFNASEQKFMKTVFQAYLQSVIKASFSHEVFKAIFQAISIAVSVRLLIVGTLIVQIKVLLWKKSLRELFDSCANKENQNFKSVCEISALSMEEDRRALNPYAFGQGGQQGNEMEGFGDEEGYWADEDDMFGARGQREDDEMMGEIPDFEDQEDEIEDVEDELDFGGFDGFAHGAGQGDLRRVPSISDVAGEGNFYGNGQEDHACGNGIGEEWPNAVFLNHDVIDMVLGDLRNEVILEPIAPPIPLPPADEVIDLGAANAA